MYMSNLKKLLFNHNLFYNLGFCRILFYSLTLHELWASSYKVEKFYYYQLIPKDLWTPVGIFKFYPQGLVFSLMESHILLNICCVFLFFTMIGLITRISAIVSFILALLLLGYPNNFGTIYDTHCLFLVVLFVLIFSNMGDTLSIDNFLKKKSINRDKKLDLCWSLWTVKLITTLICLFYFTSGIQKLRVSGWDWLLSDHMSISFMHMGHPIGLYLSQFSVFCHLTALLGLITQVGAFLPIFYSWLVPLFFVLFCLFHIIVDVTFGSHFQTHFYALVFLIPWGNLLPWLPGNFTGCFWPSVLGILKDSKWKIKKGLVLGITSLVGVFVITMSLYAPWTFQHLYPFSTTTMYAWIDKEPIKRKMIFVMDRDNKKRLLKQSEIWPLTYDKLFSKFKALEKEEGGKQRMKDILRELKRSQPLFNEKVNGRSLESIKKIMLSHCFWETSKKYISNRQQPDYCDIVIEEKF